MFDPRVLDEFGIFDPRAAARNFGPWVRFKGGESASPPSSTLADTEIRKYARKTLYPMVESGMEGDGITPELNAIRRGSLYEGLYDAYNRSAGDAQSQFARTIDPRDYRVKNFADETMERGYYTAKDNIGRMLREERVSDIDIAQALSNEYLAGEKRMTVESSGMYNNALAQEMARAQNYGTFGTNIASGAGSGLGSLYGAYNLSQRYTDMANKGR